MHVTPVASTLDHREPLHHSAGLTHHSAGRVPRAPYNITNDTENSYEIEQVIRCESAMLKQVQHSG
jgi:hypothetical protein